MNRFTPITAALVLMVAACSTTTATTATNTAATTVAGAEVALTAADQVAITYITQKSCAAGNVAWTCSDPATVTKIKALGAQAYSYVKQAEQGVVTVQAAMAAIDALTAAVPAGPAAVTP